MGLEENLELLEKNIRYLAKKNNFKVIFIEQNAFGEESHRYRNLINHRDCFKKIRLADIIKISAFYKVNYVDLLKADLQSFDI